MYGTEIAGPAQAVKADVLSQPAYLWHTFYGSDSSLYADSGRAVAVDGSGNVYITGQSCGSWPGLTPIHPFGSQNCNVFVAKLNLSGALQWHTFFPGWKGEGITVDGSGNVYVVGKGGAEWPGLPALYSGGDAFYKKRQKSVADQIL